jgi:hypothetical protein
MVNILGKKRLEVVLAIAGYAVGDGAVAAIPTPCWEASKQVVLTAADIAMYTTIWKTYFEEELSNQALIEMLTELGLVTVAALGTAYVVAKASAAIFSEISDWIGPVGWSLQAAISGSLTGLFGLCWALYCDRLYCEKHSQPA